MLYINSNIVSLGNLRASQVTKAVLFASLRKPINFTKNCCNYPSHKDSINTKEIVQLKYKEIVQLKYSTKHGWKKSNSSIEKN